MVDRRRDAVHAPRVSLRTTRSLADVDEDIQQAQSQLVAGRERLAQVAEQAQVDRKALTEALEP